MLPSDERESLKQFVQQILNRDWPLAHIKRSLTEKKTNKDDRNISCNGPWIMLHTSIILVKAKPSGKKSNFVSAPENDRIKWSKIDYKPRRANKKSNKVSLEGLPYRRVLLIELMLNSILMALLSLLVIFIVVQFPVPPMKRQRFHRPKPTFKFT